MSGLKNNKNGFLNYIFSKNRVALVYFVGMILSWITFFVYAGIQGDGYYRILFHGSGNDTFMDFYNSCRDAAQGMGCYTERGVIYPPMANLFYKFCNLFITNDYLNTDIFARLTFASTPSNLMIFIAYTSVTVAALAIMFYTLIDGSKARKTLSVLFFIMNFPFIYLIERGNILIIAYLLCMFFVFYYDSDNKYVSEFACICLALAAAIKVYPAAMGLLLVIDKRYKQAIRTVVYGALLFALPFGVYNWKEGLVSWINNIIAFSHKQSAVSNFAGVTSVKNSLYLLMHMLTGKYGFTGIGDLIVSAILVGICVLAIVVLKEKYQKFIAMFILMTILPGAGGNYIFVFLSIPLLYMFNSHKLRIFDYLYFLIILAIYMPYPLPIKFNIGYVSVNFGIAGFVVLFLFIFMCIDLCYTILKDKKIKVKKGAVNKVVASLLVAIMSVAFISGIKSSLVYADEKPYEESGTVEFDGVTYNFRETPQDEIPYGFSRGILEKDGHKLPVLTRPIGQAGQSGMVMVADLDDGSGYKFYTYNTTLEALEPYVEVVCNGISYTVLRAITITFPYEMRFYGTTIVEINGVPVEVAEYITPGEPDPDHREKDNYLLCLLDENNEPQFYSYEMLDGFNCNLTLFIKPLFYPTPYPASIGNHTLAKTLNVSAEKITIVCMLVAFVPTMIISIAYCYIRYSRERKNPSKT